MKYGLGAPVSSLAMMQLLSDSSRDLEKSEFEMFLGDFFKGGSDVVFVAAAGAAVGAAAAAAVAALHRGTVTQSLLNSGLIQISQTKIGAI
jgi:hypothetical protein